MSTTVSKQIAEKRIDLINLGRCQNHVSPKVALFSWSISSDISMASTKTVGVATYWEYEWRDGTGSATFHKSMHGISTINTSEGKWTLKGKGTDM